MIDDTLTPELQRALMKMSWRLRYRHPGTGVDTTYILASTFERAQEVGAALMAQMGPNYRYINVTKAYAADESILADVRAVRPAAVAVSSPGVQASVPPTPEPTRPAPKPGRIGA